MEAIDTDIRCVRPDLTQIGAYNRSFYVDVENTMSSLFQLLYGFPHGSVPGPHLFILYTTPLSTVISNSSANHHLYAYFSDHFLLLTLHTISLILNMLY
jgi:hypothetical protein